MCLFHGKSTSHVLRACSSTNLSSVHTVYAGSMPYMKVTEHNFHSTLSAEIETLATKMIAAATNCEEMRGMLSVYSQKFKVAERSVLIMQEEMALCKQDAEEMSAQFTALQGELQASRKRERDLQAQVSDLKERNVGLSLGLSGGDCHLKRTKSRDDTGKLSRQGSMPPAEAGSGLYQSLFGDFGEIDAAEIDATDVDDLLASQVSDE